jgi:hypothetical protein
VVSPSGPGPFSSYPTDRLEELLRRPDTPDEQRRAIGDELSRRYEAEFSGSPGSVQPPPFQGPVGPSPDGAGPAYFGGMPPRSSAPSGPYSTGVPPARPPSVAPSKAGGGLGRALVRVVVAVIVLIVVAGVYVGYEASKTPPAPTTGTVCVTPAGTCPLDVAAPVGQACTCNDGFTVYSGTVQ